MHSLARSSSNDFSSGPPLPVWSREVLSPHLILPGNTLRDPPIKIFFNFIYWCFSCIYVCVRVSDALGLDSQTVGHVGTGN